MRENIHYQQGKRVDQVKVVMLDIMLVTHRNMNNHYRMSSVSLLCPFCCLDQWLLGSHALF
jgi:hypothetical protein